MSVKAPACMTLAALYLDAEPLISEMEWNIVGWGFWSNNFEGPICLHYMDSYGLFF